MSSPVLPAYADPGNTPTLPELGAVHFIGIGGAGMSAIARIMLAAGVPVSGSDAAASAGLESLRALGARCFVGHDAAHLGDAQTVVVSSAIRPANPELAEALRRGLRVIPRAQALAAVMTGHRSVAVAGTHGKTSTTSMLVCAVLACGLDPSYAIGGELTGSGLNSHRGSDIFAAEADESDGSFLLLDPFGAIITNVEADHLDNYGDLDGVLRGFDGFVDTIDDAGFLVICADDPHVARFRERARARGLRVRTYGQSAEADIRLSEISIEGTSTAFTLTGLGEPMRLQVGAPGIHMALNATAALLAGTELGLDAQSLADGLATYAGVHRRMDFTGTAGGVRVFDDYAHHPTELTAMLRAAREVAADGRLIVCFQPHLYSRTMMLADDFAAALQLADRVIVMDIYAAREDPEPGVTGAMLTDRMPAGHDHEFVPERDRVIERLLDGVRPGDLVMTVGAGDVTTLGPQIVQALEARADD